MTRRNRRLWIIWALLSVIAGTVLAIGLGSKQAATLPVLSSARAWLLPGPTTHGHHQIELACESCHTSAFGGGELMQRACVGCHGAALTEANDKHPASKFDDPRNAFRLEKVDAQKCIACHVEHRPAATLAMGVTQPGDFCFHCHQAEGEMPSDHKGLPFNGCTAAGCHNYHDNRALYEDFLLKHAGEPPLLAKRELPLRELAAALQESMSYPQARYPLKPLAAEAADAPKGLAVAPAVHADWLGTAHAQAGVNCSGCHVRGAVVPQGASAPEGAGQWVDRPSTPQACEACHAIESKGFKSGKHGMRLASGLPPMSPTQARLPMKADAHGELTCTSCHGAHRFDTRAAAVEACTGCHADRHTLAFKDSPHFALLVKESQGELPAGSGVSCASCHMPRQRVATEEGSRMAVQHNQNDTLQPNEKMIRPVCLSCHGLGFSIDALADRALIDKNFLGQPSRHVESIDMAVRKDEQEKSRRSEKP